MQGMRVPAEQGVIKQVLFWLRFSERETIAKLTIA